MGQETVRGVDSAQVSEFVSKLRQSFNVQKILLFGSRARGDYFESSDYDFIIVSDDFQNIPFPYRPLKVYELWPWDKPLEVLCYTAEEYRRKSLQISIVSEALKEGLEL